MRAPPTSAMLWRAVPSGSPTQQDSTWPAAAGLRLRAFVATAAVLAGAACASEAARPSTEPGTRRDAHWYVPRGPMLTPRDGYTSTLLSDGRVLVAGGNGGAPLSLAELYDGWTDQWTAALPMPEGRWNHTATPLCDGRVLVVGGDGLLGPLASAVTYDPVDGQWQPAGELSEPRRLHTATRLADCWVLVVGGGSSLRGDLYDPGRKEWSTTAGTLPQPLAIGHTATRLPNGQVLLAGGQGSSAAYSFSALSSTFSVQPPLGATRDGHTATLLPSGLVKVVGGSLGAGGPASSVETFDPIALAWSQETLPNGPRAMHAATVAIGGDLVTLGGTDGGAPLSTSARYYSSWFDGPQMAREREAPVATTMGTGKVLVTGGRGDAGLLVADCELYVGYDWGFRDAGLPNTNTTDPHTMTVLPNGEVLVVGWMGGERYDPSSARWSIVAGSPVRGHHTATLLTSADQVLVVGGEDTTGPLASVMLYDVPTGAWQAGPPLAKARQDHTATLLADGRVLVVGGRSWEADAGIQTTDTSELYDPRQGRWVSAQSLPGPRSSHRATLLPSGKVLLAGGAGDPTAWLYDAPKDEWTSAGSISVARSRPLMALLPSGRVLVAGGRSGTPLGSCDLYDPVTNSWRAAGPMITPRADFTGLVLPSGEVVAVGGAGNVQDLDLVELYEPFLDQWLSAENMASARVRPSMAVLPDGRALIYGGGPGPSAEVFALPMVDWRPTLNVPGAVRAGTPFTATGARLTGVTEGSSGSTRSSPADFPLVLLLREDQGLWLYAPTRDWTSTRTTVTVPASALPGRYWAYPVVNGVLGRAGPLLVLPAVDGGSADGGGSLDGGAPGDGGGGAGPRYFHVGCDCQAAPSALLCPGLALLARAIAVGRSRRRNRAGLTR